MTVKFTQLPASETLDGAEILALVQDGESRRATAGEVAATLPVFTAAEKGAAPAVGGAPSGLFLRDDGTWAAPAALEIIERLANVEVLAEGYFESSPFLLSYSDVIVFNLTVRIPNNDGPLSFHMNVEDDLGSMVDINIQSPQDGSNSLSLLQVQGMLGVADDFSAVRMSGYGVWSFLGSETRQDVEITTSEEESSFKSPLEPMIARITMSLSVLGTEDMYITGYIARVIAP